VEAGGRAIAIDERLNGAVSEFTRPAHVQGRRRRSVRDAASRRLLRAESVLFAGFGNFDSSGEPGVHEFCAEKRRPHVRAHGRSKTLRTVFGARLWRNDRASARAAAARLLKGMATRPDRLLRRITFSACSMTTIRADARGCWRSPHGVFDDIEATVHRDQAR